MKDSAVETRGKTRLDKVTKEDHNEEQTAATTKPHAKRGRPRKAENNGQEESEDRKDDVKEGVENEDNHKKTKQLKQVHDAEEEMISGDETINGKVSAVDFQEFVKELHNNVSVEEMMAVLQENGLDTLGSDDQLYQRGADLLFYGTCESCPSCGGTLEFAGQSYQCSSYSTEWAKCNYGTQDGRKGGKAKLQAKSKNNFLKKWVKAHEIASRQLDPSDKPFLSMVFQLGGRMSRPQGEIRKLIESYGGKVVNSARQGVTAFMTSTAEASRGGSEKMEDAMSLGIPICRESWLFDSIEKMQAQPLDGYNMAAEITGSSDVIPWDKRPLEEEAVVSMAAELKIVGRKGVYKDTILEDDGGEIYVEDGITYNCVFSVCDIYLDLNQYAILQLIEVPLKKSMRRIRKRNMDVYLYLKEGRVGDRRGVRERFDRQESAQVAVKEFCKLFELLTGNDFSSWEAEKNFSKKRNKFFPIDMAAGVDARAGGLEGRQLGIASSHCMVDSRVVEFLRVLFSQSVYRSAMSELAVDAPDLPTGILSDWHLDLCKQYLSDFCAWLKTNEENEQKKEQVCLDFSNKWFTLLHSTRPFIIHDLGQLAELASPTLETLRDISCASRILGDMTGDTFEDPIGDRYAKLECEMTPVDREGPDYRMIQNYFLTTMEPLKFLDVEYDLVLEDVVQLESKSAPSLKEIEKIPNKKLLWCGMRTSNLVAALSRGLLPAPIDAPAPYYSFGKGIYCTDAACNAARYGFTAVDRVEGFLLLAVVGLGDGVVELPAPAKPVKEYEEAGVSVKVLGKKAPSGNEEDWKHGVTVPYGPLSATAVEGVQEYMDYNEYVVYSTKQIKPVFLLKTRFDVIVPDSAVTLEQEING